MTLSQEIVSYLKKKDEKVNFRNFRDSVLSTILEDEETSLDIDEDFRVFIPDRRPDAYKICKSCRTIFLYEIDDQNPITEEKLMDYAQFWFILDSYNWTLMLYLMDKYDLMFFKKSGRIQQKRMIDLKEFFYLKTWEERIPCLTTSFANF
jgi:hypothetical protein